jgi:P2 family phage contractile tail tube protein
MAIQVSKVFNANVYIDGTNEQIGRASEIKLPDIAATVSEHKGLGMVGTLELPSGLQAMVLAIKWSGFYGDQVRFGGNPFQARKLQIRASHETYGAEGRVEQLPLVVLATGHWKKMAPGTFKPQEAADGYDDELAVSYLKISLDGTELLEVDVFQNIWRVDGEDVLETMRQNLGG